MWTFEAGKCKYNSVVPSCHFGHNLRQLNLHWHVLYKRTEDRPWYSIGIQVTRCVCHLDSHGTSPDRYLFKFSKGWYYSVLVRWPQQTIQEQEELFSALQCPFSEQPGTSSQPHMGREHQTALEELWKWLQTALYCGGMALWIGVSSMR